MELVETLIETDAAIFSASVTVYAESAPEALDRALNLMDRYAARVGKPLSITEYRVSHDEANLYSVTVK